VVRLGSGVEKHDGFAAPDDLRLASSSYDFHVYLGHRAKNAVSVHVAGEFKIAMTAARPSGLWRGCQPVSLGYSRQASRLSASSIIGGHRNHRRNPAAYMQPG
jgi:hypothetical protein